MTTTTMSSQYQNHMIPGRNFPTKYMEEGDQSRTSTLSSGYESGCVDSDLEDVLSSLEDSETANTTTTTTPDYFVLESDAYVTLDENTDYKLRKVKESMMNIITDLQSLGFETSLADLTKAVKKSTTDTSTSKSSACSRRISERRSRRPKELDVSQPYSEPLQTSPVDQLFKEIEHNTMNNQSQSRNEKLYSRLISNLAMDCLKDEPIYEEITDDCEFDDVLHSDTYRRSPHPSATHPPALPPRPILDQTFRRATCPDLPLAARQQYHRQKSTQSLTEVEKVKYKGEGKSSSWMHYPTTR